MPVRLTAAGISSGDHTGEETPVPIPNTAVKLSGPMIVPTSAKVGIARFYFKNPADSKESSGVFAFESHLPVDCIHFKCIFLPACFKTVTEARRE